MFFAACGVSRDAAACRLNLGFALHMCLRRPACPVTAMTAIWRRTKERKVNSESSRVASPMSTHWILHSSFNQVNTHRQNTKLEGKAKKYPDLRSAKYQRRGGFVQQCHSSFVIREVREEKKRVNHSAVKRLRSNLRHLAKLECHLIPPRPIRQLKCQIASVCSPRSNFDREGEEGNSIFL